MAYSSSSSSSSGLSPSELFFRLGQSLEDGKGVKKNRKEAFKYFKKSADQDYAKAQCKLGFYYDCAKSVKKNLKKAF